MKKIFRKNQIIITLLALMIAVAGYLNFSDTDFGFISKQASTDSTDTIVEDIESLDYDITDETALLEENAESLEESDEEEETATDTPGEAVLTNASGFAAQAKVSRDQIRSQNKEELQSIIDNEQVSDEQKQSAIDTMVSLTDISEKENAIEMLLEAKGFENVVVNLTGESADVVVPMTEIPQDQRAQIEDIVKRKAGVSTENIVITPLSQEED